MVMNSMRKFFFLFALISIALIFSYCTDTTTGPLPGETPQNYSHTEQPGTAANDFLADSNFTDLVLEVDYMPGYAQTVTHWTV